MVFFQYVGFPPRQTDENGPNSNVLAHRPIAERPNRPINYTALAINHGSNIVRELNVFGPDSN